LHATKTVAKITAIALAKANELNFPPHTPKTNAQNRVREIKLNAIRIHFLNSGRVNAM